MTNNRLNEILDEQKIVRYRQHFLKAMKQAVNEAITESIGLCYDNLVDKPIIDGIRNLKVK